VTPRVVIPVLLVVVAAAVGLLLLGGDDDPYTVRLQLDNAGGLRDGADVVIGGVRAGKVDLDIGARDEVIADLEMDSDKAPVGKNVRAGISAINLLGQKRVEVVPGDANDEPAPDGYLVPKGRVTMSTDLDQVLSVLDADTRARLTVLVNEAGAALLGRQADVSLLLKELPPSLVAGTQLLDELSTDNETLARLVSNSDGLVAALTPKRNELGRLVDTLGQTAGTLAARRRELRATLARAPATLATLQAFLGDLRATTVPLRPAARDIADAAPAVTATLAQVDPLRRIADPTLRTATAVAPDLTRLAAQATPVLRKAGPTANSLAALGEALPPVSDTLDHSAQNLIAILQNWSRAIQFRDGLSHIFRGEATASANLLTSAVDRFLGPTSPKRPGAKKNAGRGRAPNRPARPAPAAPAPRTDDPAAGAPATESPGGAAGRVNRLLDYLLGP
jgi:phospholipid/cholesterol/gamma-HCH transport system substrate-binding protein